LDKLLLQPELGNSGWGQHRATKEADLGECNPVPSLPDSILFPHLPGTYVPGSDCPVPFGTGPVASINLFGVEPRKTFQPPNLRRVQPLRISVVLA